MEQRREDQNQLIVICRDRDDDASGGSRPSGSSSGHQNNITSTITENNIMVITTGDKKHLLKVELPSESDEDLAYWYEDELTEDRSDVMNEGEEGEQVTPEIFRDSLDK